jgi:hypothetical protein
MPGGVRVSKMINMVDRVIIRSSSGAMPASASAFTTAMNRNKWQLMAMMKHHRPQEQGSTSSWSLANLAMMRSSVRFQCRCDVCMSPELPDRRRCGALYSAAGISFRACEVRSPRHYAPATPHACPFRF